MKKLYLLSGMMVFTVVASSNVKNPGGLTEEERQKIENVQWGKIERQYQLARPSIYKTIDALIKEELIIPEEGKNEIKFTVDWPAVFKIIDSMQNIISVNEYKTDIYSIPLIFIAVLQGNVLATKTLLEQYKANPNISKCVADLEGEQGHTVCHKMSPLMWARKQGDNAMVNLLIKYGARE